MQQAGQRPGRESLLAAVTRPLLLLLLLLLASAAPMLMRLLLLQKEPPAQTRPWQHPQRQRVAQSAARLAAAGGVPRQGAQGPWRARPWRRAVRAEQQRMPPPPCPSQAQAQPRAQQGEARPRLQRA